jgi:hypothetical protein
MMATVKRMGFSTAAVQKVYEHLRACGQRGMEGVALWAGVLQGDDFVVTETIIPKQRHLSSKEGLAYVVEGDELHRINVWLYQNKLKLGAQIHSHPGAAYHSDTDDAYPILTEKGAFSLVVPDFGFGAPSLMNCAVYRLDDGGLWRELPDTEKTQTFFFY